VILTGEAIKRKNARAIDELFARDAGKFVCATAGHKLECTLAAHGSGAVRLSKQRDTCVLHVDIGGGTTKLALIDRGEIVGVSAFAVGGRLLAEGEGGWTRVDDSARLVAEELGIATDPASLADAAARQRIATRLAEVAADKIVGAPSDTLGEKLQLTDELPRTVAPTLITFSGGVSEYVFGHEPRDYGDIARLLATALIDELKQRTSLPLVDPGHRIRATVIGASQFTVQVSGKTIYLPRPDLLPVHNIPVVHVDIGHSDEIESARVTRSIRAKLEQLDLSPDARMAIAFSWTGDPEYTQLREMSRGIRRAVAPERTRDELLLLMIDGDIGRSMGFMLDKAMRDSGKLISIDGVKLQELDYVDVGEMITPPGVVPVVIKSLLFS
jgi:ethanolamine utilization protein EutA